MNIKLATLNLCLGLKNKREEVKRLLSKNGINILCLQETEIEKDYDKELLNINKYKLELENNSIKARVGIYIDESIAYIRRTDLEGENKHLIVLDIMGNEPKRIINIYRSFNPQDGSKPKSNFISQMLLIKEAYQKNLILL